MKKLFTLLLALVMVACLGVAAFAEAEPALEGKGEKPEVTLSSNTATVTAGSSTTGLTVEAKNFDGDVKWSVNAEPKNDKISGSVSGTALTINTDATLTAGTYTIKVKAEKNGHPKQDATATLTLTVNEAHVCGNGVKQDGQAATCAADGWKDYYKCSCGKF